MIRLTRALVTSLASLAALSACSPQSASGIASFSGLAQQSTRTAGSSMSPKAKGETLVVANAYNVTTYNALTGTFQRKLDPGIYDGRVIYVTNTGQVIVGKHSLLTIYGGSTLQKLQRIKINPGCMATDPSGNLYVLSEQKDKRAVEVFAPGTSLPYDPKPVRIITSGVKDPLSITVDSAGNLYVPDYGRRQGTFVSVYAPGSTTPTRTITQGVKAPRAVAVDASGRIYVSNSGYDATSKTFGSITVYAPGTTTLTNTITTGISNPYALGFDPSGNLYVADLDIYVNDGYVTAYAAADFSLIRTITKGVIDPFGIAFDGYGNLFVANEYSPSTNGYSAVTVYAPNSSTPTQSISKNVSYPSDVAVYVK